MNLELESKEIIIHQEVHELIAHYAKPASFKELMPPEVTKFEANSHAFNFALKNLPEVRLNVEEISEEQVLLKSASDKLPFFMRVKFKSNGEATKAQIHFEGDFNPMLKMMVQRPLQTFINHLAENMEAIH